MNMIFLAGDVGDVRSNVNALNTIVRHPWLSAIVIGFLILGVFGKRAAAKRKAAEQAKTDTAKTEG
jgi:hypothetical protein